MRNEKECYQDMESVDGKSGFGKKEEILVR